MVTRGGWGAYTKTRYLEVLIVLKQKKEDIRNHMQNRKTEYV